MKRILPTALLLLASCGRSEGPPQLQISGPWAREMVAGQSATAAYMTIVNRGTASDRLIGVEAPPPVTATLHETSNANGIARMRPMASGLEVPAGGTAQLEPGGTHLMIVGLTSPLKEGDRLKLTLRFERSGQQEIDMPVRSAL